MFPCLSFLIVLILFVFTQLLFLRFLEVINSDLYPFLNFPLIHLIQFFCLIHCFQYSFIPQIFHSFFFIYFPSLHSTWFLILIILKMSLWSLDNIYILYIYIIYIYIYIYILYIYIYIFPDIGMMVRVFAKGPGGLDSIPGRVIPKTQKMVLDASLLNTQQYNIGIKGKVDQFQGKE